MTPREILSGPEKWCQNNNAVANNGLVVDPCSQSAVKWCMVGACWKSAEGDGFKKTALESRMLAVIKRLYPCHNVTSLNDTSPWEQVDAVLNEAFPQTKGLT